MPSLVIFEQHAEDHGPLARTRPVLELRCGTLSLGDRLERRYPDAVAYHEVRPWLAPVHPLALAERGRSARVNRLTEALEDDVLLIDGAILATSSCRLPPLDGPDELGVVEEVVDRVGDAGADLTPVLRPGGRCLYLRLRRDTARQLAQRAGGDLARLIEEARRSPAVSLRQLDPGDLAVMTYPWDLIEHNGAAIVEDFALYAGGISGEASLDPATAFLAHGRRLATDQVGAALPVHVGRGTTVGAFVSFDVSEGPVIIDEEVTIESHCHLKGPCFVGRGSTLWAFADVKEACSLGPRSRVCGQVEEAILQGWTHKFHVGFVGHSYLGEGVNVGDQTVTSNLKNDRTPVVVHLTPERRVNSGRLYLGSLIGDGAATGTNTNLTTGAVVEPLSTVVSAEATPKYVNGLLLHGRHLPWPFRNAYGAMRILIEQRLGRPLPEGHETLMRHVYQELRPLRKALRSGGHAAPEG